MTEIKECKNCAFYRPHYAKGDDGQLYEVTRGHCTHTKVQIMKFRHCFSIKLGCNYWRECEDIPPQENINDIIKQAAANIELLVKHFDINKNE